MIACRAGWQPALQALDTVYLRCGPDEQATLRDGRSRHAQLIQRVLAQQLEFLARLDHEGVAIFAEREDLAVIGPWRRREGAGGRVDALLTVDLLAGAGIVRRQEPAVEQ